MNHVYLNLGCGPRKLPGFINVDLDPGADLQHDVTKGLPFPDASVDGITSEHFLEHISQAQAIAFFRECRRVLAPGGVLRVATPDLDVLLREFHDGWRQAPWLEKFSCGWIQTSCEYVNISMREWGHQWLYNEEELVRIARYAGLELKRRWAVGESDVPMFQAIEYRDDSLIVEFVHPSRPVYSAGETPLVSVLIPAYNPRFFRECLESALAQTYENLEILVFDDCPTEALAQIVEPYLGDPRIRYRRNRPALGALRNYLELFEHARGEYVKYLNDDDRLSPTCVERMAECLNRHSAVTLVTSHRQTIDEAGRVLPERSETQRIVSQDAVIGGAAVAGRMLALQVNFIGEPTTAMFRKADVEGTSPTIFSVGGFAMEHLVDIALWLNLLSKGDLVYLTDTLSSFRRHGEQQQATPEVQAGCWGTWPHLRAHAQRMGFELNASPGSVPVAPLASAGAGAAPGPELGIFHPGAPALDLGETRAVRLLCIPAWESTGWTEILRTYATTFAADDPVSLVLRIDPPLPEVVAMAVEAVRACLRVAGVPEDEAPDLLLEASEIPARSRGGLYTAVSAFLSHPGGGTEASAREAAACGLQVLDGTDAAALRELVEGAASRAGLSLSEVA